MTTQHPSSATSPRASAGLVPALTILYHPRLERIGDRALLRDIAVRDAIGLSRLEPCFVPPGAAGGAPLEDIHLSRKPLRLLALPDRRIRVEAAESRTRVAVQGAPLQASRDLSADELEQGAVIELAGRIVLLLHMAAPNEPEPGDPLGLVGGNDALEQVRRDIRRVADLDLAVLLRGETGTGKELVARAIHETGDRRGRPFIAVNMAALPSSLAAAELFGAERGAYTGAGQGRPGYFGLAQDGTLFLDEIGEAPPDVQAMLLRALETGEIQAVGAQQPKKTRARLIAATDADLEAKVAEGTFRAPLLHRLAGFEITLPPLRGRRDDIGRLIVHFLREELASSGEAHRLDAPPPGEPPWLPASFVARLAMHDWPGNVRQLRNTIRQLVVGNRGAERLEELPAIERLLERTNPALLSPAGTNSAAATKPPPPENAGAKGSDRGAHPPDQGAHPPDQGAHPPDQGAHPPDQGAHPPDQGAHPPDQGAPLPDRGAHPPDRGRAKRAGWRKPSDVSEEELLDALRRSRWDLKAAAERLGVSRTSLYALVESCPRVRLASRLPLDEIARCYKECGGRVDLMVDRLEVSKQALLRRIRELRLP